MLLMLLETLNNLHEEFWISKSRNFVKSILNKFPVCRKFEGPCYDYPKIGPFPRCRGGSRAAATSQMECFVIIVNGFQPLIINTKRSILDVAAVLDPPLSQVCNFTKKVTLPQVFSCEFLRNF